MRNIRNQYCNFVFFQKHKKYSYFYIFDRINELVFNFSAPIKYAKAQFNPIILSRIIESTVIPAGSKKIERNRKSGVERDRTFSIYVCS